MVCCQAERFGCCSPYTGLPATLADQYRAMMTNYGAPAKKGMKKEKRGLMFAEQEKLQQQRKQEQLPQQQQQQQQKEHEVKVRAGDAPVYALFVEVSRMWALTINSTSGVIAQQHLITNFNNWGEITRVFMWDSARVLFYYVEANFTAPPAPGGDPSRVITLTA